MEKAFLLGAGLGTRLRPLTDRCPKPLVPLFHRPLIEWTLEACVAAGLREFAINTHHLPEVWKETVLDRDEWDLETSRAPGPAEGRPSWVARWRGLRVSFFHEPVLLETGGGLRPLRAWIGDDPILVHNGDIFSTIGLAGLIDHHQRSRASATLAVRSTGISQQLRVVLSLIHI